MPLLRALSAVLLRQQDGGTRDALRVLQHPWRFWGRGKNLTGSYVLLGSPDQEKNGLIFVAAVGPEVRSRAERRTEVGWEERNKPARAGGYTRRLSTDVRVRHAADGKRGGVSPFPRRLPMSGMH